MKLGSIVYVDWVDSTRNDGWHDTEELAEFVRAKDAISCRSVGWLMGSTRDRIVISTSTGPDNQCLAPVAIPRKSISRIRLLTVGD